MLTKENNKNSLIGWKGDPCCSASQNRGVDGTYFHIMNLNTIYMQ